MWHIVSVLLSLTKFLACFSIYQTAFAIYMGYFYSCGVFDDAVLCDPTDVLS